MACDGKTYIPNPPRLWNRVQLPCSSYNLSSEEYYRYLMMKKGNILQYKKNSSCLTKKQIYSLMAQKKWTNRNTTWATQNDRGYTNPNTKMLKRNNSININISGPSIVETTEPITCPTYPNTTNDGLSKQIVVSDLGTLICNVVENPCTSYKKTKQSNQIYHPTSDSDVPGPIKLLYWNKSTQTWYPRRQLIMNTSNNKWPETNGQPVDVTYIAATSYNN